MTAIYNAFLKQEIACNDLSVQNSGCANVPVGSPEVTATSGDKRVTLTWTQVDRALSYDVMRAEGGCEKGKVKVANVRSDTSLRLTDTGLKNGFEVSAPANIVLSQTCCVLLTIRLLNFSTLLQYCYLIVPKGTAAPSSCYGKKSTKIEVKPGGSPPTPDTPQPTRPPTPLPTRFPTPLPTRLPTPLPTSFPTPLPTTIPTPLPTTIPTPIPTNPMTNPVSFAVTDISS